MVYADTTGTVQNRKDVPLSQRPHVPEAAFAGFCERLTEFAEWMAEQDMPIAYHPHMGTLIETEAEMDRLMEGTGGALGLALDCGHLAFAGGDYIRAVRRHGHRISHVHCKDLRPEVVARIRADDASFLDAVVAGAFTVPGDGAIDFRVFVRELLATGYTGWMVVEAEQDPAVADPLTYARLGYNHLAGILEEAGAAVG